MLSDFKVCLSLFLVYETDLIANIVNYNGWIIFENEVKYPTIFDV